MRNRFESETNVSDTEAKASMKRRDTVHEEKEVSKGKQPGSCARETSNKRRSDGGITAFSVAPTRPSLALFAQDPLLQSNSVSEGYTSTRKESTICHVVKRQDSQATHERNISCQDDHYSRRCRASIRNCQSLPTAETQRYL